MASAIDVISKLQWYTLFPRLTQANLKTILSSYGYLSRDYNLNDASNYVQNISSLLPDGVLNVLWTEYPFVYPTPVLNEHPYNIKLALQAAFQADPNNFLSRLDGTSVYNLLNDESTSPSVTKVRYVPCWTKTYGASRHITMGKYATNPSGNELTWNDPFYPPNNVNTINSAPTIVVESQPASVKSRVDSLPEGYKCIFVTQSAFAPYLPVSGENYVRTNDAGLTKYPGFGSFAEGAPRVSLVDPFVSGVLGGIEGTALYTNPSGYPGIYFDSDSWDDVTKRCKAWFKSYKDIGGQLDSVILDSENDDQLIGFSFYINKSMYYTGNGAQYINPTGLPVGSKPSDQIYKDSRWNTFSSTYPSTPPSSQIALMPNWLVSPNDPRDSVFTEIGMKRVAKQFNQLVFETIRTYFPNIKLFNYLTRMRSPVTIPGTLGNDHLSNPSGVGGFYGNRQSTQTYFYVNSLGSLTGYIYQDWDGTKNFPPITDYAYSNGIPHSGGYIGFLENIRTLRTSIVTSQVPLVNWVLGAIDSPYYPRTLQRNTLGTRRTGSYDYLYDESVFHSLLCSEDLVNYTSNNTLFANGNGDFLISNLGFPISGSKTLVNSLISPIGISGLTCWYDFSDTGNLFQNNDLTVPVNAVGQSVGSVRDKSGNLLHASGILASTAFPVWQSGTNTRSSRGALFCNGSAGLFTQHFPQSVFSGGYTFYFCLSASGVGGAPDLFGTTSSSTPIGVLANGNKIIPRIAGSVAFNNTYFNTPLDSFPGAGHTFGMTFDPKNRKLDSVDTNKWVDFYCDGQFMTNNNVYPNYYTLQSGLINGTLPDSNSNYFMIGGRVNAGAYSVAAGAGAAYFHEILAFNRPITDAEARSLDGYFHNKYNLLDRNGNPTAFYTYPNRSDIRASHERISNAILEFESVAGQEAGITIPYSEAVFHAPSGLISSRAVFSKIVSRFTPHPSYANSHTVLSNSSGVQFNVNGQIYDFPRGVITTPPNPLVSAPSGYWVVTPNRTGQDINDFNSSRLLAVQSIFGSTPPDLTPPLTNNTAPAIYGRSVNEIGGVVINAGNSDRFINKSSETIIADIVGSNPVAADDSQVAATNETQLSRPEEGVYNISETSSSSPRRSISYTTTARTEKQNIPTTSGINPETGEFLSPPVVQLDSFGADDAAQPTLANPGSITFNTGSSIPRSQNYPPKSL